MKKRIFLFIFLMVQFQLYIQKVYACPNTENGLEIFIEGRVLSLPKRQAIAFANIGIVNSSFGTISDQDGSFSILIPKKYTRDTILFSALGYEQVKIPIADLLADQFLSIYLKEVAYRLPEIVVTNKSIKTKRINAGNKSYDGGIIYADVKSAGSAMALLIKNKSRRGRTKFSYPQYVQETQLRIDNNTFERFKVRARLYDVEKVGDQLLPGKDILNESVVIESEISNGWLTFDLSPYGVKVEADFFIVFEWILEKKDRAMLLYQFKSFKEKYPERVALEYSKVNGEKIAYDNFQGNFYMGTSFGISVDASLLKEFICYYRLNSQGRWSPSPTTLAAKVLLSNQSQVDREPIEIKDTAALELNQLPSYYHVRVLSKKSDTINVFNARPKNKLSFSNVREEPIQVLVLREQNTLSVDAINKSNYPYQLTLSFSNIVNLLPVVSTKVFTIYPGRKQLMKFNVVSDQINKIYYDLAIKEVIGDPSLIVSPDFPYLLPMGKSKSIELPIFAPDEVIPPKDLFVLNPKDTVFAMRKGKVTSTVQLKEQVNKIAEQASVEVLHADGTVMVYQQLDSTRNFLKLGQTILPGDPIGIVNQDRTILVELFQLSRGGFLEKLPILYHTGASTPVPYLEIQSNTSVVFPDQILMLEMNEREQRDYKKKN